MSGFKRFIGGVLVGMGWSFLCMTLTAVLEPGAALVGCIVIGFGVVTALARKPRPEPDDAHLREAAVEFWRARIDESKVEIPELPDDEEARRTILMLLAYTGWVVSRGDAPHSWDDYCDAIAEGLSVGVAEHGDDYMRHDCYEEAAAEFRDAGAYIGPLKSVRIAREAARR